MGPDHIPSPRPGPHLPCPVTSARNAAISPYTAAGPSRWTSWADSGTTAIRVVPWRSAMRSVTVAASPVVAVAVSVQNRVTGAAPSSPSVTVIVVVLVPVRRPSPSYAPGDRRLASAGDTYPYMYTKAMVAAMAKVPAAAVAASGLVGGYGIARWTEKRPLGGVALAAAGALAAYEWNRQAGPRAATALTVAYVAAFAGSHPLAKKVGAWPAVFAVAGGVAAASWTVTRRAGR